MTEPDAEPGGGPAARIVKMTPQVAARLIEARNDHNRGVTDTRVDQYAQDMRRGTWQFNGEAIKIAKDGTVLDGQHRLLAILQADVPVITLVVTGLERNVQESMDQGKPRGFHDVLKLRGEPNPNVLAAAVKLIATYERDGVPFARGFASAVSNQAAALTLERNPSIRDAVTFVNRIRQPWMPVSNMAALYFLMSAVDDDQAATFFRQLSTGEGPLPVPIMIVRQRLIADYQQLEPDRPREHLKVRMVYVVMAWNAVTDGTPLGELRWRLADPFPGLAGLAPSPGLREAA